ncbi:MAG TPA: hypothetical protein VND83_10160 [Acidimicrobiales bacterium]|nr:hypothetical protein [Acidimicrobiales bacterium]
MKSFVQRVLVAAVLLAGLAAAPLVGATTPASAATAASACGVTSGATWRLISTSPCKLIAQVGSVVPLSLDAHYRWTAPTRSSAVVRVTASRMAPGGLIGTVRAVRVGKATVSSAGVMVCPAGEMCPSLAILWRLHVQVVAKIAHAVTVKVTQADAGATFDLRKGDKLVISLTGPTLYTWTVPVVSVPTVLDRLSGAPGHASFVAMGTGTTIVSAVDNPNCYPACLPPSRIFQVHVVVAR